MKKVYVFLADGFEEIEALTVVDLLRRAGGKDLIETTTVSIMGRTQVIGTNKITVVADALFEDVDFSDADMLVLPGGIPGTPNLKAYGPLTELLCQFNEKKSYLAAICAAPTIFADLGFLEGKQATCYPSRGPHLTGATYLETPVVIDGHIITSRGVGTAIDFGAALTEILLDKEAADKLKTSIVYRYE